MNHSKIVESHVGELRTPGALAHRPYTWRGCLETIIHSNVAAVVEFDASLLQSKILRVRDPAGRNKDIGTFEQPLALRTSYPHPDLLTGHAFHSHENGL